MAGREVGEILEPGNASRFPASETILVGRKCPPGKRETGGASSLTPSDPIKRRDTPVARPLRSLKPTPCPPPSSVRRFSLVFFLFLFFFLIVLPQAVCTSFSYREDTSPRLGTHESREGEKEAVWMSHTARTRWDSVPPIKFK